MVAFLAPTGFIEINFQICSVATAKVWWWNKTFYHIVQVSQVSHSVKEHFPLSCTKEVGKQDKITLTT